MRKAASPVLNVTERLSAQTPCGGGVGRAIAQYYTIAEGRRARGYLLTNSLIELGQSDPEVSGKILANLAQPDAAFASAITRASATGEIAAEPGVNQQVIIARKKPKEAAGIGQPGRSGSRPKDGEAPDGTRCSYFVVRGWGRLYRIAHFGLHTSETLRQAAYSAKIYRSVSRP